MDLLFWRKSRLSLGIEWYFNFSLIVEKLSQCPCAWRTILNSHSHTWATARICIGIRSAIFQIWILSRIKSMSKNIYPRILREVYVKLNYRKYCWSHQKRRTPLYHRFKGSVSKKKKLIPHVSLQYRWDCRHSLIRSAFVSLSAYLLAPKCISTSAPHWAFILG